MNHRFSVLDFDPESLGGGRGLQSCSQYFSKKLGMKLWLRIECLNLDASARSGQPAAGYTETTRSSVEARRVEVHSVLTRLLARQKCVHPLTK